MKLAVVSDQDRAIDAITVLLERQAAHEVIWVARSGGDAVGRCADDPPDLLLLDPDMERKGGVETVRVVMRDTPCAILLVTATVEGNAAVVFEAMGWGALDAVATPVAAGSGAIEGGEALLKKILTLSKLIGRHGNQISRSQEMKAVKQPPPLVPIGSSTGGPRALSAILAALPAGFPGAVVIVQHIDFKFTDSLAGWLAEQTPLPVQLVVDGDPPAMGKVLLATGDEHLVMREDQTLGYSDQPADCSYRPSVDVFFESVARHWIAPSTAVLLTGMGRDGARGMRLLFDAGWHTIAQDEETSAVFGMPRAAIELQAVRAVLPIHEIGTAILDSVGRPAP